jgi:hypothetical protein
MLQCDLSAARSGTLSTTGRSDASEAWQQPDRSFQETPASVSPGKGPMGLHSLSSSVVTHTLAPGSGPRSLVPGLNHGGSHCNPGPAEDQSGPVPVCALFDNGYLKVEPSSIGLAELPRRLPGAATQITGRTLPRAVTTEHRLIAMQRARRGSSPRFKRGRALFFAGGFRKGRSDLPARPIHTSCWRTIRPPDASSLCRVRVVRVPDRYPDSRNPCAARVCQGCQGCHCLYIY